VVDEDGSLSFKHLFGRAFAANPERLHMAAHSHHLWPDASFDGHMQYWQDAARLADLKWDKVMGEVWPEAQRNVAGELGTAMPDAVVFASSTHDFLVRLVAAAPRVDHAKLRVLTSDAEFHSARRQFARWAEQGWLELGTVAAKPFEDFSERFLKAAKSGGHDLILVSQILYGSGWLFDRIDKLAALGRPDGPWVVIDGYHAFMALDRPLGEAAAKSAFYLGGGYKYAMAGENCAFLHAPPGSGARPPVTGWFAEFEDRSLPPGAVGYAADASRFMGATFDSGGLYRFNAVRRMLADEGLTTAAINARIAPLQAKLLEGIAGTRLAEAELLNPLDGDAHARFLAFKHPGAARWYDQLIERNCITDVRGDVLRVGLGLYHDEEDVDALASLAGQLQ
jgi:selenocysteine lyase/cysteine desulfurase